jgi:catechol 2,3-dioxygenase-like lactoylglutathione lyase family enzyme
MGFCGGYSAVDNTRSKGIAMITGIQDIYYNVLDMKRAVAFYRDVLGLQLEREDGYWTSFDLGGAKLGLHWTGGNPVPHVPRDDHGAHAGATLTLHVSDAHKVYEELRQKGVTFLSGVHELPWGDVAVFEDPDGNVLKIMRPRI